MNGPKNPEQVTCDAKCGDCRLSATSWQRLRPGSRQEQGGIHVLFELGSANQADLLVRTMCRMLKVSASGYYAWPGRPPAQRVLDHAVLTERIRAIHAAPDETYGRPNIPAELRDEGICVFRHFHGGTGSGSRHRPRFLSLASASIWFRVSSLAYC